MKKKIKMYYAQLPNMGDLLNILLVRNYFGYDLERHNPLTCELSGIGSGLGHFTLANKIPLSILERVIGVVNRDVLIWGTGFIEQKHVDNKFYHKNIKFCAVRGELTKKRVEDIIGTKLNIPTGDGGILASLLLNKKIEKKYNVGIIPHFKEMDNKIFHTLANNFKNSILINLRDDPMEVIKQISECDYIISSSLHGLIVADSFGIPNQHIYVTDVLLGDGFKFLDYYSAYGIKHKHLDLNETKLDNVNIIIDNYKLTNVMIEDKKKSMIDSFPFK